ncbi:hypothetical protein F4678DRAFT_209602 [Xylaria arbuscula]|nr:hypothetical protein F4678DRAFT_209602 [Xylaria arbuscula]
MRQQSIRDARLRLEAFKSSLELALSTAVMSISVETAQTLCLMERRNIIDHCLPPIKGMTDLHADRKSQQEPETCNWIRRDASFTNWLEPHTALDARCRFIWVHGIPGAGKTVLASSIVEKTALNCNSKGYAYYYCLYSRDRDETVPCLKWVLRQLCKQNDHTVPRKLSNAYEREDALSIGDLLDCLEEVSLSYRNGVYIIVDAVDESRPRESLLSVLSRIGTDRRFWKVSLLFTSRVENEILEPITRLKAGCAQISMSNMSVRADLRHYVHERLSRIPAFMRWENDPFLGEIERTLTQKANGMFRWAVCQLDVLRRMRDRESIIRTLEELPRDIFETYERILKEIPAGEQQFAKTALALICSDTAEIPTAEILVSACLYGIPFGEINKFSVDTLKDSCGSLISLSKLNREPSTSFDRDHEEPQQFHRCTLAHYTVKEYLYSPEIANGAASFFALSDQVVGNIDLKVIFTGLSQFGFNGHQRARRRRLVMSRYEEYCLDMTELALGNRRADIILSQDLREIVFKSLTPSSPHFSTLSTHGPRGIMRTQYPRWLTLCIWEFPNTVHPSTGCLLHLVILNWRELGLKYLESPSFQGLSRKEKTSIWTSDFKLRERERETLLGYCLRERQIPFLRIFAQHGASFELEFEALFTMMGVLQRDYRARETLEFLLRSGADPNPTPGSLTETGRRFGERGFAFTPLQLAIYKLEYDWIEVLLEEGADIHMTGAPDGAIPSIFDDPDPQASGIQALREIGQLTALSICARAEPEWIRRSGTNGERIKTRIGDLLRRHGAEEAINDEGEPIEEDQDRFENGPDVSDVSMNP